MKLIIKIVFSVFIISFYFNSSNLFAYQKSQESNKLKIIKNKNPRDQLVYYTGFSSIYANDFVENIDDWIEYFEKQIKQPKERKDLFSQKFILIHLYRISNKLDKAIDLGLETYYGEILNENTNFLALCRILKEIEVCYDKKNNNIELVRINKEKFKVCNKSDIALYRVYYNMGLYDLALKAYRKQINFGNKEYQKNSLYVKGFHKNDFGVFKMYDNKIDSAFYFFNQAKDFFHSQKKDTTPYNQRDLNYMLTVVDGNIANCYLKRKQYDKAIPLFLKEIKGALFFYEDDVWLGSEKTYNRIATSYLETNQLKKALYYIEKLKKFETRYFKLKSDYFSKINNNDSTIFYKNKFIEKTDSIYKNEIKQKQLESLGVLEVNEKLTAQQQQIKQLEREDNYKSTKINLITFFSSILLILFLLLLKNNLDKNKKQKLVAKQKEEIELALNSNKTLLKELNHRVKNNLQMISSVVSLQASKIKDNDSKKHFKSVINRIKVLSKIHNSLYSKNELEEIELSKYVIILKDYLINSIVNPEIKVNFNIKIDSNLLLTNDTKTTIGLIINELITNSFKYGFNKNKNNTISISIYKKQDFYHFKYTDDGKGFDYEKIDKSKSIGLNLIMRLVNQLGEKATIHSNKEGMQITFKFIDAKLN